MKTGKRQVVSSVILGITVFLIWYAYNSYQKEVIFQKFQSGGEKALTGKEFSRLEGILIAKYSEDTYGSSTPEGTLELFVSALRAGDAKLASKYFIPEKQKEAESKMINKPNQIFLDAYLGGSRKVVNYSIDNSNIDNISEITISSLDKEYFYFFKLILNKYTNIWKIQSI